MHKIYTAFAALALTVSSPVWAEGAKINAQATKFDPLVVFINPGETVAWNNMSGHNSVTVDGLIPAGAEGWNIRMGENGSVTLEQEGVYVYKCTPHFAMGMGGAVVVGKPNNFEAVKTNANGMAKRIVVKTEQALKEKGML